MFDPFFFAEQRACMFSKILRCFAYFGPLSRKSSGKVRPSANEDMHLAMYADEDDILTPEFIRTYQHVHFKGSDLLTVEEALRSEGEVTHINKSVILRPGKNRAIVHQIHEAYGYRPSHPSVWYLNVWEFCMYWKIQQFGSGQTMANLDQSNQLLFPDKPELQKLRRAFFLARRHRPRIPAPYQTKLPKPGRDSKDEIGRLLSIYLRPWTLLKEQASVQVPYLADLNKPGQRKEKQKATGSRQESGKQGYWEAWLEYIQGNVVSRHQCRIIQQFMAVTGAVNSEPGVVDVEEQVPEQKDFDKPVWDWEGVQRILTAMGHGTEETEGGRPKERKINSAMDRSLQIGAALWAANDKPWPDDLLFGGNLPSDSMLGRKKAEAKPGHAQGTGSSLYAAFMKVNADAWLCKLSTEELCPNTQQLNFLKQVIDRTQREAEEEFANLAPGPFVSTGVNY